MAKLNPLQAEHLAALNKVLQAIPTALELTKKCEACGLDVSAFREQLLAQQQMAAAFKKEFFPQEA